MRLGLVGRKLGYSRSPLIHGFLSRESGIGISYELVETDDPLSAFTRGLDGFNVTVPYKEAIMPGLSWIDPLAARIGAVNTVLRSPRGWEGYNTDYDGFGALLSRAGVDIRDRDFIVMGSGGAAKGAALRLADGKARSIRILSRRGRGEMVLRCADGRDVAAPIVGYGDIRDFSGLVAVNSTPAGTDPDESSPMDAEAVGHLGAAIDLVYNPFLTPFLRAAVAAGVPSADGLDMLAVQGARAFESWTGFRVDGGLEDRLARMLRLKAARGVAIVGMPFSGKSTLLKRLAPAAAAAGVPCLDLDEEIEREAGLGIPGIFSREGEEGFRKREHAALERCAGSGAHILACGGGALTRPDNLSLLKQDLVLFLDLPLPDLISRYRGAGLGSRPLVKSEADLEALYAKRLPVYRSAARARGPADELSAIVAEWLSYARERGGD